MVFWQVKYTRRLLTNERVSIKLVSMNRILIGSAYGPNVRKWMSASTEADLGQCFVTINPDCFAPNFEKRLSDLIRILRNLPPVRVFKVVIFLVGKQDLIHEMYINILILPQQVDNSHPVLVAGDPENSHIKMVDLRGGIEYHSNQLASSVSRIFFIDYIVSIRCCFKFMYLNVLTGKTCFRVKSEPDEACIVKPFEIRKHKMNS